MGTFLHANGRSNYASMQVSQEERKAVSSTKVDKNPFGNKAGSVDDLPRVEKIAYYKKVISMTCGSEKRHYERLLKELELIPQQDRSKRFQ
jgi:pyocin large subunit-like protein